MNVASDGGRSVPMNRRLSKVELSLSKQYFQCTSGSWQRQMLQCRVSYEQHVLSTWMMIRLHQIWRLSPVRAILLYRHMQSVQALFMVTCVGMYFGANMWQFHCCDTITSAVAKFMFKQKDTSVYCAVKKKATKKKCAGMPQTIKDDSRPQQHTVTSCLEQIAQITLTQSTQQFNTESLVNARNTHKEKQSRRWTTCTQAERIEHKQVWEVVQSTDTLKIKGELQMNIDKAEHNFLMCHWKCFDNSSNTTAFSDNSLRTKQLLFALLRRHWLFDYHFTHRRSQTQH